MPIRIVDGLALVPEEEFREMEKRIAILDALEAGGVDNWEWYGESLKGLLDEDEEDDV